MAILTSKKVRFTVDEYFRLTRAGVFDNRHVELLDGRIVEKHAQSDPHMAALTRIGILLTRYFSDTTTFWLIYQGTCVIEPYDAPDPDFHVFDVPILTPAEHRPLPFIIIEASYTTYRRDSGIKLRRYAAAGIKDYWIVNIPERRVAVCRDPQNPTGRKRDWQYKNVRHYGVGEKVKMLAYPKIELPVREMLP